MTSYDKTPGGIYTKPVSDEPEKHPEPPRKPDEPCGCNACENTKELSVEIAMICPCSGVVRFGGEIITLPRGLLCCECEECGKRFHVKDEMSRWLEEEC